ncbi:MAG: DUF1460 domain-containing protein [Lachnoclostridium sp.]|nr:DUF1460 domain-containing protein [Lachnoclostridium sp.]
MRKFLTLLYIIMCMSAVNASGATLAQVRWHDEAQDTIRVNELLRRAMLIEAPSTQARVGEIARMFIDTPYGAGTLEGQPEMLVVNLDSLDCTTLVENVAAIAITVGEGRNSWQDFLHNLENIRYRGGSLDGYASRLHYISSWIIDNDHRGNLKDVTDRFPEATYCVKSLDFMSRNRDKYPALADDGELQRIKDYESIYRNHRFPYIKSGAVGHKVTQAALQDGDIVAFVTKKEGLDVSHMGIIVKENGVAYLLHASPRSGKVEIDKRPLAEYLRKATGILGIRVVRLMNP